MTKKTSFLFPMTVNFSSMKTTCMVDPEWTQAMNLEYQRTNPTLFSVQLYFIILYMMDVSACLQFLSLHGSLKGLNRDPSILGRGWKRGQDFLTGQHFAWANQRHFGRKNVILLSFYCKVFAKMLLCQNKSRKQFSNTVAEFFNQQKGSVTSNKNNWAT